MGAVATGSIPFVWKKRLGLRGFDGFPEGVFCTVAGQFQSFQERKQVHAAEGSFDEIDQFRRQLWAIQV